MGWPDVSRQSRRFQVLLEGLDGAGTLLDYGCGFGDLSEWWPADYIGYDLTPEMLAQARIKFPDRLFVDRPVDSDWVVASGVFNLQLGADLTWPALQDMWIHARRGIAFNLLIDGRGRGIEQHQVEPTLDRCHSLFPFPGRITHRIDDPSGDLAVWGYRTP